MRYENIEKGTFIKRPNRFIAHVLVDGKEEIVHVKNTGRCKEILKEGATVILERASNPNRKTRYSIIAAYKDRLLINIDSQVPNDVIYNVLKEGLLTEFGHPLEVKKEVTYRNSRFDLYCNNQNGVSFIEVKGVTLEEEGKAMFPDAPTERGRKHILEMIQAVEEGYQGYIFFLIQFQGAKYFTPNKKTDPEFARVLRLAKEKGVKVLAYDSQVTENSIKLNQEIPVIL